MSRNSSSVKIKSPEKRARIGERIKLAATSAGYTLKDLAAKVGTQPTLIYQYVRGITNVPPGILQAIATATRVNLEFFDPDKDARSAFALPSDNGDGETVPDRARIAEQMRHLQTLADAYGEPRKNLGALTSTLYEMLALARVNADKKQEAYLCWQIGAVKNETSDYDEARQYLIQARDLFESLGLEQYRIMAVLDLAHAAAESGAIESAIGHSREVAESGQKDMRWRALINIGGLHYRQRRYEEAMRAFTDAARALEDVEDQERENVGMPYLMTHLANVAKDTGHYDAALALWSRSLAQAAEEKRTDVYLESLLNAAQCCQLMGKISEAKQRLEQAVVLASFMFDDQNRLGVARALLADVMVALGSLDEARENAKSALRIASRVGGPRGMILSSLALAETCQAAGQYDDALGYVDDAIREAQRSRQPKEQAQARNLRARVCLQLAREDDRGAWIKEAEMEANRARDVAQRIDATGDEMAACLTLGQCYQLQGNENSAEEAAQQAIELARNGAIGLPRLLGEDIESLPDLLKVPPIDLERLFSGKRLQIPAVEWQAHYLRGTVQARTLGPQAAFVAMRDAADALGRLLTGLNADDAIRFRRSHPEISAVYEDLTRYALTDADQQEARALLQSAVWFGPQVRELPALEAAKLTVT